MKLTLRKIAALWIFSVLCFLVGCFCPKQEVITEKPAGFEKFTKQATEHLEKVAAIGTAAKDLIKEGKLDEAVVAIDAQLVMLPPLTHPEWAFDFKTVFLSGDQRKINALRAELTKSRELLVKAKEVIDHSISVEEATRRADEARGQGIIEGVFKSIMWFSGLATVVWTGLGLAYIPDKLKVVLVSLGLGACTGGFAWMIKFLNSQYNIWLQRGFFGVLALLLGWVIWEIIARARGTDKKLAAVKDIAKAATDGVYSSAEEAALAAASAVAHAPTWWQKFKGWIGGFSPLHKES